MFVEECRRIEGKFSYNSWWTKKETICKVIFIIRKEQTKVIVLQRYGQEGTSPTNCYEDIAASLYREQLSTTDIKNIQWYLYYIEAKKVLSVGDYCEEGTIVGKAMFQITMDWRDGRFGNLQFNVLNDEQIQGVLEINGLPSDLYWDA
jgi:hypothetical protein